MFSRFFDYLEKKLYAKRQKENRKINFFKAVPFLKKGTYYSNETGFLWYSKQWKARALPENKYIIQQVSYAKEHAAGAGIKIGFFRRIKGKLTNRINCQRVKVKDRLSLYDGDVTILSREVGVGKVINYSKKEILSFFKDREQMQKNLGKRQVWQTLGFPVPAILQINETECFFVEEYIEKQGFSPKQGFEFVRNDILLHQETCGDKGLIACPPEELAEKVERLKKLVGKWEGVSAVIDFVQSPNYVKRICHGDLYRNNLIFDGQKFRYIDFEKLTPCVFFLDVLFYMANDFLRFENEKLLSAFFAGEYDAYFHELFAVNHSVYDPAMKNAYLFLALYEYFCEIWKATIPEKAIQIFVK